MSIIVDKLPVAQDRLVKFQEIVIGARTMRGPHATQAWAAAQAGVSQSLVVDIERGPAPGVQLFTFWRYMRWLGVPMAQVLEVFGLEKTRDVEDADLNMRFTALRGILEDMPRQKREQALDMIQALIRGMQ